MLSSGFAGPLRLQRKRSKLLALYLISLHMLGVIALLQPINLPIGVYGMLFGSLSVSALYHARYYRLQHDDTAYWIWHASGHWQYGDELQFYQLVISKSVQTNWFVTLTLATPQQQRRLLIIHDQVDADTFRRLRVRIKLHHDDTAAGRDAPV